MVQSILGRINLYQLYMFTDKKNLCHCVNPSLRLFYMILKWIMPMNISQIKACYLQLRKWHRSQGNVYFGKVIPTA